MQENEVYNPNESGHNEVRDLLSRCKLLQYMEIFINEGFDTLKSLCEVSEDDMIAMKVKRGHRRLIQREIATLKGIPRHEPLWIGRNSAISAARSTVPLLTQAATTTSSDSSSTGRQASGSNTTTTTNSSGRLQQTDNTTASSISDQQPKHHHHRSTIRTIGDLPTNKGSDSSNDDSNGTGAMRSQMMLPPKRRYRRHPKPDRNAPAKPPSAYVMFSNDLRAKLKDQNLTFAQLAKLTGERWKALSTTGKSQYEKTATDAKNAYLVALNHYRQTPEFKLYQEYLKDFRAKHEPHRTAGGMRKKIKPSVGSPGSGSLADSSSNGNSNGVGSSSGSSGGSADGYYYDSNDTPEKSKLPTTNDEDDDGAVLYRPNVPIIVYPFGCDDT
ncbi:hypothetical protein BJV82DRAFT_602726 [Fennellomyces sp. T-0311]|nr:hypothetical protein BJV82DRAFT_602726 [Fennellomyces sp. T-0311]